MKTRAASVNGANGKCADCGVRPGKEHRKECRGGLHDLVRRPAPRSKYPTVRAECRDRYCLLLTDAQILRFAGMHHITKKDIPDDCFDSLPRDIFIDSIVRDVLGRYCWPTFGDEPGYAAKFFPKFFRACEKRGIRVQARAKKAYL